MTCLFTFAAINFWNKNCRWKTLFNHKQIKLLTFPAISFTCKHGKVFCTICHEIAAVIEYTHSPLGSRWQFLCNSVAVGWASICRQVMISTTWMWSPLITCHWQSLIREVTSPIMEHSRTHCGAVTNTPVHRTDVNYSMVWLIKYIY